MSSSWVGHGPSAPQPTVSASNTRQKKATTRQLLSCTKCRERKVKCDRTVPCSACCARGHPNECKFVVGEGNDYQPISQSYEVRRLRAENDRLKERLLNANLSLSGDEDDDDGTGERVSKTTTKPSTGRQRRFKIQDRTDNLYFGTPGLATVIHEFAELRLMGAAHSLTHPMPGMPKGKDMYGEETSYPFKVVVNFSTPAELLELLPNGHNELFEYLDLFEKRAQSCSFPHLLDDVTKQEVERFLTEDKEQRIRNAENFPDMLALIFATMATGLQMGQYDKSGGQWIREDIEATRRQCDAFITASMQMLREASFMNRPTLLGIQTLIMMGPYLTNTGRFLDAWTLFGTTIRLAHSVGLHRHPSLLDPTPPLRETTIRQTLWWWMLHMDQQYSITLGRPLGISGFGDCPQPQLVTTNVTKLRLYQFIDAFTVMSRQILGSHEMTSIQRIDEYTDKIVSLWDTMPAALQFNESWVQPTTQLPEWPLEALSASLYAKVQSLLILLNRQRLERSQVEGSPETRLMAYGMPESRADRAPLRGRDLVINSSISVLQTFLFFYHRNRAVLICWTMGQQAFNAAMILLLDAWEMDYATNLWIVDHAYVVFAELNKHSVHALAKHAAERIFAAMKQIKDREDERAASNGQFGDFQQQQPNMSPDTAPMVDLAGDTVMGSTGMFLLEDPGLQSGTSQYPTFRPWGWNTPAEASAHPSNPSGPPTPDLPSPTVPVSQISAAPFPVMPTAPITPYAIGLLPRMAPSRRSTAPNPNFAWYPGGSTEDPMLQAAFTPMSTASTFQGTHHQHQDFINQQFHYHPAMAQPPAPAPAMQRASSRQQQRQHQEQQQSFSHIRGLRHSRAPVQAHQPQQQQYQGAGTGGRPRVHTRPSMGPRSQQRRSG